MEYENNQVKMKNKKTNRKIGKDYQQIKQNLKAQMKIGKKYREKRL